MKLPVLRMCKALASRDPVRFHSSILNAGTAVFMLQFVPLNSDGCGWRGHMFSGWIMALQDSSPMMGEMPISVPEPVKLWSNFCGEGKAKFLVFFFICRDFKNYSQLPSDIFTHSALWIKWNYATLNADEQRVASAVLFLTSAKDNQQPFRSVILSKVSSTLTGFIQLLSAKTSPLQSVSTLTSDQPCVFMTKDNFIVDVSLPVPLLLLLLSSPSSSLSSPSSFH